MSGHISFDVPFEEPLIVDYEMHLMHFAGFVSDVS